MKHASEDHLKNKEKEILEVKTRKAKDMTDLLKNQDSLIKLTGVAYIPVLVRGTEEIRKPNPRHGWNLGYEDDYDDKVFYNKGGR